MVSSQHLPGNVQEWEDYLSTRRSIHATTKYAPVDVTLSTAGTAENLFLASTALPTVNITTNPSFETADPPTSYTAAGSTLTSSTTVARSGTDSASINPDNSAAGEGIYWAVPEVAGKPDNAQSMYLVVSAYFNDNAGSSDDARIEIRDSAGTTTHATGNTVTLAASWQRSTARFLLPITPAAYRIYLVTVTQHNTTFFADDLQVEVRQDGNVTDYCDGAAGINYEWFGTAHASESRRRPEVHVIRGYDLHVTKDVYLAFNNTASSTTGIFLRAGSDFSNDWPLYLTTGKPESSGNRISFINAVTGETPRIWGTVWGIPLLTGV